MVPRVQRRPLDWSGRSTPPRWRIRGALALLTTLAVREAGRSGSCFARVLALLRFATRYGRPAGDEQALFALNGVRHAARLFPARIACLEESVAAMFSLTLAGCRACWCHGVAADPLRLHAWVEADGKRVGEILLAPEARGRGLATEATRLTLDYAFHLTALAQVWLKVLEPNAAAIRAYERAGFQPAGRLRQAGYWHGQRCDELLMDVLPADFPGPSAFTDTTTIPLSRAHQPGSTSGQLAGGNAESRSA